jgi:hypothetical protein
MSHRRIHLGLLVLIVAAVPVVGCGGNGSTPASPAGVPAGLLGNNPDGSTLKVTAPALQSPTNFLELDDLTPTFRFTAAQGLYVPLTLGHEVEVLTEGGQQLRLLPVGPGVTQVTYPGELDMASTYQWRVRATYQGHVGPWSGTAAFVTRSIPQVTPETLDEYLIAFSAGNANWAGCSAGQRRCLLPVCLRSRSVDEPDLRSQQLGAAEQESRRAAVHTGTVRQPRR